MIIRGNPKGGGKVKTYTLRCGGSALYLIAVGQREGWFMFGISLLENRFRYVLRVAKA